MGAEPPQDDGGATAVGPGQGTGWAATAAVRAPHCGDAELLGPGLGVDPGGGERLGARRVPASERRSILRRWPKAWRTSSIRSSWSTSTAGSGEPGDAHQHTLDLGLRDEDRGRHLGHHLGGGPQRHLHRRDAVGAAARRRRPGAPRPRAGPSPACGGWPGRRRAAAARSVVPTLYGRLATRVQRSWAGRAARPSRPRGRRPAPPAPRGAPRPPRARARGGGRARPR